MPWPDPLLNKPSPMSFMKGQSARAVLHDALPTGILGDCIQTAGFQGMRGSALAKSLTHPVLPLMSFLQHQSTEARGAISQCLASRAFWGTGVSQEIVKKDQGVPWPESLFVQAFSVLPAALIHGSEERSEKCPSSRGLFH